MANHLFSKMKEKNRIIKNQLIVILFELFLLIFIAFKLFPNDLSLGLSFWINTILTFFIVQKNINRPSLNISANSVSIFVLLFFIIAPVIQVDDYVVGSKMVNNLPYNPTLAIIANFQISLFLLTFILIYFFTKKKVASRMSIKNSGTVLKLLIVASVIIFVFSIQYATGNLAFNGSNNDSIMGGLVLRKSIFMIPVAAFAMYFQKKGKVSLVVFLIILIILFLKNPISERRNAIGPLYLALLFFMFKSFYHTNFRSFIYIFLIFFILFPLSSIITNSYLPAIQRIESISNFVAGGINSDYFKNYFNTLHYDAWSNICATIEFVEKKGFSFGKQFIGGILFFVPRFLWESKPIGTGHLIANDFLIPRHNLWLSNISCPIISEGYINFGFIGIIFITILLALFLKKIDSWLQNENPLYQIFGLYSSFWLFYLMRGDFMSAWAYLCGAYIGIVFIPMGISKLVALTEKNKFTNNETLP